MLLLLARHGNTFSPGQKVVWLGAKDDLPLVESGQMQAKILGQTLAELGLKPDCVFYGPLKRAERYAELVVESLSQGAPIPISVEARLNEIDYGLWSGCSDAEIIEKYGAAALEEWNKFANRPKNAAWQPSDEILKKEAKEFLAGLQASSYDLVLLVSSNGRLRYLCEALGGKLAEGKMKTGHISLARIDISQTQIISWNQAPAQLKDALAQS